MARPRKWLLCALVVAAHLAVFALYAQPDFLVTVANQLWSCF